MSRRFWAAAVPVALLLDLLIAAAVLAVLR